MSMFRRAVKDLRWTVAWYAIGLAVYGVVMVAFYPSIEKLYTDMMKSYPKDLLKILGTTEVSNTLAGFLGAEFLNIIWPAIAAIFLIMAGSAVVAREIESGTAEFWLSVPVRRGRLLTAKLAALVVGSFFLVVTTVAAVTIGAWVINHPFSWGSILPLSATLLTFCLVVGGYSALFSAALSSRARAAGAATGLTVAFYLAWVVSTLSDSWSWLEHFSVFTAFGPQQALENGTLSVLGTTILVAIAVVCGAAAVAVFERREAVA
jgi:ABC-2 type transport system permease protein